jgi:hypothetical protein
MSKIYKKEHIKCTEKSVKNVQKRADKNVQEKPKIAVEETSIIW